MRRVLIFLFFLVYFSPFVKAQVGGKQVPITIPSIGSGPNALLYLPWDYNISGKAYPLIIFGHGISETTVSSLPNQGLPGIIAHNNPPYAIESGDTVHFIVLSPTGGAFLSETNMSNGAKYLISQGIRIDTNRVYITGLSAGARSTVGYMSHQADNNYQTVYAAVPMSYTLKVSEMDGGYWVGPFSNFAGKGVWAFTGLFDTHVAVAEALIDSVNTYSPGNGRLTLYPGGHCCWMTYYNPTYRENIKGKMMNIYEWMLQFHGNGVTTTPANKPPVAKAGNSQTLTLPLDSVLLDGSASADPDGKIISYKWTEKSGPAAFNIMNDSSARTEVTGLDTGDYIFTLTIKDNSGATASADVTVTVKDSVITSPPNQPPAANAGSDQTITLPVDSVLLDGSASTDPDGNIVSYQWSQQSGTSASTIENAGSAKTEVRGLDTGAYVFKLTVTDDSGASATANVSVIVKDSVVTTQPNLSPVANAGSNQTITLPVDSVMLDGSASSDPDGTIVAYKWTKKSGPDSFTLEDDTLAKTEVSALDTGNYIFTLTVTDDSGAKASSDVSIMVKDSAVVVITNKPPVANAGSNQTITLPLDSVLLDGTASYDSDGKIVSYQWIQQSGPSSTIENANSAKTVVSALDTGTYVFTLTVADDSGATVSANISVIVKDSTVTTPPINQPPVANAGSDQTLTLPLDSVLLDGSASADPDGEVISYQWTEKSGPAAFNIMNDSSAKTEVTGLDTGDYIFTLMVKDNSGATASADVTVTVKDSVITSPPNQPPAANAGSDQTITLPVDSVLLDGSASTDPDGNIVSYQWSQQSGTSASTIEDAGSAKTVVSALDTGAYVFTLTVTDDSGATASANVSVIVKDSTVTTSPVNQQPVANAGSDQIITLPVDSVLLDGTASYDSNGIIVSYKWTQQSGPSSYTLDNADSAKTNVTLSTPGAYVFTLTVTNNSGDTASSEITVTVSGNYNGLPVANAGNDTTIDYPLNFVYLDGSKSYTSGGINYLWQQVSGPSTDIIKNNTRAYTKVVNLIPGVYVYKLTVTDYGHNSASDEVKVTVLPDPTQPGDVPYTANTSVPPYTALFQYGTNPSAYSGWNDTAIAGIAVQAGAHSLRLPLPDYFVGHYGYDIRLNEFKYYTHQLGMKEITLFVGQPRPEYSDDSTYAPATSPSDVFANLYTPIWDNGQNGTPVNDSNYFALYIYNLVKMYGKNIKFWEIVNEADATGFWDNGRITRPDNWWVTPPSSSALLNIKAPVFYYIRMLRIAYEVVKKFEPDEYICTGGIGYPAFLDALLRYTDNPDGGKVTAAYPLTGGAYFDVVSFHSYPAYNLQVWDNSVGGFKWYRYSDYAANAIINLKNTFDSVLNNHGYNGTEYPKKPFIITESNIPRKAFSTYFGSDSAQFNFIIKALVKSQENGIKQFYIYQIGETNNYNSATSPYDLMGLYQNLNQASYGQQKLTDEGKAYKTTSMLLYGWQYDSARTAALNLPSSVDGGAFRQDTSYRYVLWAKTNTDMSEAANATYSFPASLNMDSVHRYEWNYSIDPNANSQSSSQNIPLTGTPSFFTESKVVDSINRPPVADAGNNQTIMLPVNSVTLDGSASTDPDGNIVSYQWAKTAGPASYSIDTTDPVHPKITGLTAGAYTFTLTVTDNQRATSSDNVIITVNKQANQVPIANAGTNQTITLPVNIVNLDGSASFDPDGSIAQYQWTKKSGPSSFTFSSARAAKTSVSDLTAGTYIFTLTVTDNSGGATSSDVTVIVNTKPNKPPVANAGKNITIRLPVDSAILNGSASKDPDGTIAGYQWDQESGPTNVTFGPPDGANVQVYGLQEGVYVFQLTVTDNNGAINSDKVTITVQPAINEPPVANAGNDNTITLPQNSVKLDGSASFDPDGKIVAYQWSESSGPSSYHFYNAETAKTEISGLVAGTYIFTLTVTDNKGATNSDEVIIVVQPAPNQPPVADAGQNQIITLPLNSVVLDGSASHDSDGSIVAWKWIEQSGPTTAVFSNNNNATTTASGLTVGTYVFTLIVTDNDNATDSSDVTIIVNKKDTTGTLPVTPPANRPPVAHAGNNQTITLPVDSVILDGSASDDPDGKIVLWKWVKTSGPASYNLKDSSNAKTAVTGLVAGTYIFTLTVTDDSGATASAQVTITVNKNTNDTTGTPPVTPPANRPPVAHAGNNQTITLPVDSVVLDGSASYDPDGKIVLWKWVKASGPSSYNLKDSSNAKTAITGLAAGTYIFTLTVTDDSGAIASANVTITVNKNTNDTTGTLPVTPPANQPPVAHAGSNQTITLPVDSVVLDGSASYDPDGKIVLWKWVKASGPSSYNLKDSSNAKTAITRLAVGTYIFTLTVTDDSGATASANVTVTVNKNANDTTGTPPVTPPANRPPVANAGSNQNIFLPDDSTTLDGSGSYDPDGTIVSWSWSQQSGPPAATILQADSAKTPVDNLVNGVYVFTLIVTDNNGAKDTADVTIGVYKKPDQPPVANAGQDITIVAPQSAVTLDGSASTDPDGAVIKYHWDPMTGPTQAKLLTPDAPTTIVSGLQVGTYDFKLTVTANSGMSSTATVSVYVMPARDTTPTTFRIYPNPVHDELHVELDKAITGMLAFRIIDVKGRILKIYRFGQLPMHITKVLDVSGLAPGIYFIQLIEDNQLRDVRKMIKY